MNNKKTEPMKTSILLLSLAFIFINCSDDKESGKKRQDNYLGAISGALTLPMIDPGKDFTVFVDDDTDPDNGTAATESGVTGNEIDVPYETEEVIPLGTYYAYAYVDYDEDGQMTESDFFAFYGGTDDNPPAEPNLVIGADMTGVGGIGFKLYIAPNVSGTLYLPAATDGMSVTISAYKPSLTVLNLVIKKTFTSELAAGIPRAEYSMWIPPAGDNFYLEVYMQKDSTFYRGFYDTGMATPTSRTAFVPASGSVSYDIYLGVYDNQNTQGIAGTISSTVADMLINYKCIVFADKTNDNPSDGYDSVIILTVPSTSNTLPYSFDSEACIHDGIYNIYAIYDNNNNLVFGDGGDWFKEYSSNPLTVDGAEFGINITDIDL